jgi:uncharacterized membrane protein
METVNSVVEYLNNNQPLLLALAGLAAVVIHYAVDHVAGFGKLTNRLLGLVAIPGVVTAALALGTSLHATQYPIVVLIGQLFYAFNEQYKARLLAKALPTLPVTEELVATEPATEY